MNFVGAVIFMIFKSKIVPDSNIQNCLIIGHSQITKHGPRVFWKKYRLGDMALGYGGCYISQKLSGNKFRIHTFGGREVSVDNRGQDVIIFFSMLNPVIYVYIFFYLAGLVTKC